MKQNARESTEGKPWPGAPNGLKNWSISAIRSMMKTKGSSSGKNSEINSMKMQKYQNTIHRSPPLVLRTEDSEVVTLAKGETPKAITEETMDITNLEEDEVSTKVTHVTNAVSTMDLTGETHGGHVGATSPAVAKTRTMPKREDSEKPRSKDTRSSVEKILARLGPTH